MWQEDAVFAAALNDQGSFAREYDPLARRMSFDDPLVGGPLDKNNCLREYCLGELLKADGIHPLSYGVWINEAGKPVDDLIEGYLSDIDSRRLAWATIAAAHTAYLGKVRGFDEERAVRRVGDLEALSIVLGELSQH